MTAINTPAAQPAALASLSAADLIGRYLLKGGETV